MGWSRRFAACAAVGIAAAAICAGGVIASKAWATDVRGIMTVSAYVSVAGSIEVKTASAASPESATGSAQQTRHVGGEKMVAQKPPGETLSNCTAVTLVCTGPSSMRIKLRTDGDEAARSEEAPDVCASRARDNSVMICNSSGANAPNVLGVVIDY